MLVIPFQLNAEEFSVFVVLEDENLERMKANDPAQVNVWKMGEPYARLTLRDVIIASPTAADVATALQMARSGSPAAAMEYLSRGFKFRPDKGDSDLPYTSGRATQ
jgi:hypothetical protein